MGWLCGTLRPEEDPQDILQNEAPDDELVPDTGSESEVFVDDGIAGEECTTVTDGLPLTPARALWLYAILCRLDKPVHSGAAVISGVQHRRLLSVTYLRPL